MITLARLAWQHPAAAVLIGLVLAAAIWLATRPASRS